jgi:hypothetical protein
MTTIRLSRSEGLRSKFALVRGSVDGKRGAAFRHKADSPLPSSYNFNSIAALPDWVLWHDDQKRHLAKIIALLLHRPAIDKELSGAKLSALAETVGTSVFEQLCDCTDVIDNQQIDLPRPEDLADIGYKQMQLAISPTFSDRFADAAGDENARQLTKLGLTFMHETEKR